VYKINPSQWLALVIIAGIKFSLESVILPKPANLYKVKTEPARKNKTPVHPKYIRSFIV